MTPKRERRMMIAFDVAIVLGWLVTLGVVLLHLAGVL
jgi:hypothetical protein